jgi:hypothetical protein
VRVLVCFFSLVCLLLRLTELGTRFCLTQPIRPSMLPNPADAFPLRDKSPQIMGPGRKSPAAKLELIHPRTIFLKKTLPDLFTR